MGERDPATGKFLPGNKASPGRPPRKVEDAYLDAIVETARKEGQKIAEAMAKAAKGGDVAAARFIAEYTLGKPPQILHLQAPEMAMLATLLKYYDARGVSAGDAFAALIELEAQIEAEHDNTDA